MVENSKNEFDCTSKVNEEVIFDEPNIPSSFLNP